MRKASGGRASLALVAMATAIGAPACGGDDDETPSSAGATATTTTTAAAERAFSDFAELPSGRTYTTTAFRPAVRFTVPRGAWNSEVGDSPQHFAIAATEPGGGLRQAIVALHRIDRVYDPRRGGRIPGDVVPLRTGFAEWLESHPRLRTSARKPVRLLGLDGVQLDVGTRSQPPRVPGDCGKVGKDCVPLFYDGLDAVLYAEGVKGRFSVLPLSSGGELVVEQFVEPDTGFAEALAVLRPVLDGVRLVDGG